MSRRYEQIDEYAPGNEDHDYDEARQRIVDAETEGEMAASKPADACPYYTFEPEYAAWHRGRLREILKQEQHQRKFA